MNLRKWLIDEDSAERVVDRLSLLSGMRLSTYLPIGWRKDIKSADFRKEVWSSRFDSRNGPQIVVTSLQMDDGKSSLVGRCDVCHGQNCEHMIQLIAVTICNHRKDVERILLSQEELRQRSLSADASAFFSLAMTEAVKSVREEAIDRGIFYRLNEGPVGIYKTMGLEVRGRNPKTGAISSSKKEFLWYSMQEFIANNEAKRHGHAFNYKGVPIGSNGTMADESIAKLIFVNAEFPESDTFNVAGKDIASAVELMCSNDRLFTDGMHPPSLKLGKPVDGAFEWRRSESGGWKIGIKANIPNQYWIVPTLTPMYIDKEEGVIGHINGNFDHVTLGIFAAGRSMSDHDLNVLRKHTESKGFLKSFPTLPEIEVNFVGVARPMAVAYMYWSEDAIASRDNEGDDVLNSGSALIDLEFKYQGLRRRGDSETDLYKSVGNEVLMYKRDIDFENECKNLIVNAANGIHFLDETNGKTAKIVSGNALDDAVREKVIGFHNNAVPAMTAAGWVVRFGNGWAGSMTNLASLNFIAKDMGEGWFGFSIRSEVDGKSINMMEVIKNTLFDKKTIRQIAKGKTGTSFDLTTEEGYVVSVPMERLKKLMPLFLTLNDDLANTPRIEKVNFNVVKEAMQEGDTIEGADELLAAGDELMSFAVGLPEHTSRALVLPARDYQVYGVSWCDARRRRGFGGVVGDEYAVGKTLQTLITMFNAYHEVDKNKCNLVVVTKTLFFEGRWQEDAQDFMPDMRVVTLFGNGEIDRLESAQRSHVILTTYETIMNNVDRFSAVKWNVVGCDEGHKLTNSESLAYRCIHGISARQKLIITGSPMQNAAREIWALMNLTVPGLLRGKRWFNKQFSKTQAVNADVQIIERKEEELLETRARLVALGRIISPFFLRRTNDELKRQLPPVQEIVRNVVMSEEQADFYELIRATGKREIRKMIRERGANNCKFDVLGRINRLRQACTDPAIVNLGEGILTSTPSAKRQAIKEICEEMVADGKKVVITCQWNEFIDSVGNDLDTMGISNVKIFGKMLGKKRQQATDKFRKGGADVMLIQLKLAEGIELPEGDAIIITEPWWNKKREEQAIARLRRDERDKHITVVRLMVQGSVEDGVVGIAEHKLENIEAVQEGRSIGIGGVSLRDIEVLFKPLSNNSKVSGGTCEDMGSVGNEEDEEIIECV